MIGNDFDKIAHSVLQQLADDIEDKHPDIDVEWQGDILSLILDDGNVYIINKHQPTQQIWLSSPVSGGWHFQYNADVDAWVCTKDFSINLHHLLEKELNRN